MDFLSAQNFYVFFFFFLACWCSCAPCPWVLHEDIRIYFLCGFTPKSNFYVFYHMQVHDRSIKQFMRRPVYLYFYADFFRTECLWILFAHVFFMRSFPGLSVYRAIYEGIRMYFYADLFFRTFMHSFVCRCSVGEWGTT